VSARLDAVTQAAPNIEKAVAELQARLQGVQGRLSKNRAEMDAVRAASQQVQRARDAAARRALIIGRISLYIESLPDLPDTKALEDQAVSLRAQCDALEEELSDERVKERLDSILSILGQNMTRWASELKLEHSAYPLRLDLKKLTKNPLLQSDTICFHQVFMRNRPDGFGYGNCEECTPDMANNPACRGYYPFTIHTFQKDDKVNGGVVLGSAV